MSDAVQLDDELVGATARLLRLDEPDGPLAVLLVGESGRIQVRPP